MFALNVRAHQAHKEAFRWEANVSDVIQEETARKRRKPDSDVTSQEHAAQ